MSIMVPPPPTCTMSPRLFPLLKQKVDASMLFYTTPLPRNLTGLLPGLRAGRPLGNPWWTDKMRKTHHDWLVVVRALDCSGATHGRGAAVTNAWRTRAAGRADLTLEMIALFFDRLEPGSFPDRTVAIARNNLRELQRTYVCPPRPPRK